MDIRQSVLNLWQDMDQQNWQNLSAYFTEDAVINWRDTNEQFTVSEFITANSQYPGDWQIRVEQLMEAEDRVISVVKVMLKGDDLSFHATSFFQFKAGKIILLDEYWSQISEPPKWRMDLGIGKPIG